MEVYRFQPHGHCDLAIWTSGPNGRWNMGRQRILYVSHSRALACLELLMWSTIDQLKSVYVVTVHIPDGLSLTEINRATLPGDWREFPHPPATKRIGEDWRAANGTMLSVPSAAIPEERNYVVNLDNPDAAGVRVVSIDPYQIDHRLV